MNYVDRKNQLLNQRGTSFWLRNALIALDNRDPVDAANDVAALHHLCQQRADELLAPYPPVKLHRCAMPMADIEAAGKKRSEELDNIARGAGL